jgi:hypothetical protein
VFSLVAGGGMGSPRLAGDLLSRGGGGARSATFLTVRQRGRGSRLWPDLESG